MVKQTMILEGNWANIKQILEEVDRQAKELNVKVKYAD